MKAKRIFLLSMMCVLLTSLQAQNFNSRITSVKDSIDHFITANGNRQISGSQVNSMLNKILDLLKYIDTAGRFSQEQVYMVDPQERKDSADGESYLQLKWAPSYTLIGNRATAGRPNYFISSFADTSKVSNDSVFARINGSWVFQYKFPNYLLRQNPSSSLWMVDHSNTGYTIQDATPLTKFSGSIYDGATQKAFSGVAEINSGSDKYALLFAGSKTTSEYTVFQQKKDSWLLKANNSGNTGYSSISGLSNGVNMTSTLSGAYTTLNLSSSDFHIYTPSGDYGLPRTTPTQGQAIIANNDHSTTWKTVATSDSVNSAKLNIGVSNYSSVNNGVIGTGISVRATAGGAGGLGESHDIDEDSEATWAIYGYNCTSVNSQDALIGGTSSSVINSPGAIAIGVSAVVGDCLSCTAIGGEGPNSFGQHSLSLQGGKANGDSSVAIQLGVSNGKYSFAVGPGNTADGIGSVVIGGTDKSGTRDNTVYLPSIDIWDNKVNIAAGSNKSVGTATLSSGTVTISNNTITSNSIVLITGQGTCTNCGAYRVTSKTAGTSFTITSTNGSDASTVAYLIIN